EREARLEITDLRGRGSHCQTICYCLTIMTSDAAPVRPDAVVASLRSAILTGVLAPGDAVTEALVADTFHVARPTARIAIDRLVAEGILAREPHHAARVRRLDRDDLADLFAARAAVESAAVELLAGTSAVPDAASAAHERLSALDADASYWAIDIAFHRALVQEIGRASCRE